MNNHQRGGLRFSVTFGVVFAALHAATAQPTAAQDSPAPKATQQSQAAVVSRPQIVYRVPSRETAEALHAQSKAPADLSLPVDANMPISLQISRSNANAEAAAARAAEAAQVRPRSMPRARKQKRQNLGPIIVPRGGPQHFMGVPKNTGRGHGKHGRGGD